MSNSELDVGVPKDGDDLLSRLTPIFSREMSLQAHFSFGAQTVGGPHTVVPRVSSSALCPKHTGSNDTKGKHFCWRAEDGSHCTMACGDDGVSVAYNKTPRAFEVTRNMSYTSPLPLKTVNPEEKNSNKSELPLRSLTFSGPNKSPRPAQKQYGRRCKSTAHIVLKQNETSKEAPHEFHCLPKRDYAQPKTLHDARSTVNSSKKTCSSDHYNSSLHNVQESETCYSFHPPHATCCSCHYCMAHLANSLPCSCRSCIHMCHHLQHHMACHPEKHSHCYRPQDYRYRSTDRPTGRCQDSSTFNSHKSYNGQNRGRSPGRNRSDLGKSPRQSPSSRRQKSFQERPVPNDRRDSGPRLPRVGVTYPPQQDERRRDTSRSKSKARPRTIHIDVYCSTSSDDDTAEPNSSDDSPNPTHLQTLVELGSKHNKKNEVDLKTRLAKENKLLSSDVPPSLDLPSMEKRHTRSPRQSAFITDLPHAMSSSPSRGSGSRPHTPASGVDTSIASDATKILSPRVEANKSLPKVETETPPVRPTTLTLSSLASPTASSFLHRRRDSSLSYVSSPVDPSAWDLEQDIPSSVLSWRGSEFDASASQPPSDYEGDGTPIVPTHSEVFYEGDSEGTEVESNTSTSKHWRSPHLERKKYIQRDQEERYREALKKRALKMDEPVKVPSDVDALSKLSVFKNFSDKELEVISKSLSKRDSDRSGESRTSFRAIEREESLKLLERMASCSESKNPSVSPLPEDLNLDHRIEEKSFNFKVSPSPVRRSLSLNSRHSSSASSRSRPIEMDSVEDDLEIAKTSNVTSPLSKSLQNIPDEVNDLVSELERPATSLPSCSSPAARVPVVVRERLVNVGVFRNLQRFPLESQTVPHPCSPFSPYGISNRQRFERMFVRPQIFGEVLRSHTRRPFHFGPPRNPQCSCESCRCAHAQMTKSACDGLEPVSFRTWSMSDLRNGASPSGLHPRIISPSLILNSTASDISALPQLGDLALHEAQQRLEESSAKLDLIRQSLETLRGDLSSTDSAVAAEIEAEACGATTGVRGPRVSQELENRSSSSPCSYNYTSLQPCPSSSLHSHSPSMHEPLHSRLSAHNKWAAVTGKLEVRLIGVQDLLEDVPGRCRRDSHSGGTDLMSLVKGVTGKSSSKSYSVKDDISNEVMAVLKLDNNKVVGQTSWKPCSQSAWDQRFSIELERSRDLEIDIYWRDWRSLCAVKFLRLEEFIDDVRSGMALQLEPQGLLFAEIKFLNPMISRKPKLQRQKKLFRHNKMPRPNQMNINVAAWGRLIKNIQPGSQDVTSHSVSVESGYPSGSSTLPSASPHHLHLAAAGTAVTSHTATLPTPPSHHHDVVPNLSSLELTGATQEHLEDERTPGELSHEHRPLSVHGRPSCPASPLPPPPSQQVQPHLMYNQQPPLYHHHHSHQQQPPQHHHQQQVGLTYHMTDAVLHHPTYHQTSTTAQPYSAITTSSSLYPHQHHQHPTPLASSTSSSSHTQYGSPYITQPSLNSGALPPSGHYPPSLHQASDASAPVGAAHYDANNATANNNNHYPHHHSHHPHSSSSNSRAVVLNNVNISQPPSTSVFPSCQHPQYPGGVAGAPSTTSHSLSTPPAGQPHIHPAHPITVQVAKRPPCTPPPPPPRPHSTGVTITVPASPTHPHKVRFWVPCHTCEDRSNAGFLNLFPDFVPFQNFDR
ncbi:C2 domain [Trinorchestia longiramus]|nr:C2 domain [Trinorchestia longiramus]